MTYKVVFSPEAQEDLWSLYVFVAERAGQSVASSYLERIEAFCRGFEDFPNAVPLRTI